MTDRQTMLPRRALEQPSPAIYPGGDCGPCVLAGLLGASSVAWMCRWLEDASVPPPLSWWDMHQALDRALRHGALDRLIAGELPRWGRADSLSIWGEPSWSQNLPWFAWLRMAIDAGYYAVCSVDSMRRGPWDGGKPVDGDHWVMIVGARESEEPTQIDGCSRIVCEVLISNSSKSAKGEEWVEVREFLSLWGGYNAMLARPVIRGDKS